jgi:hypothetical protein
MEFPFFNFELLFGADEKIFDFIRKDLLPNFSPWALPNNGYEYKRSTYY